MAVARRCVFCRDVIGEARFCPRCGVEQPAAASDRDALIGSVLAGRYEIVELIGSGGMGRVYRAVQRPLDRVVAVKVMEPELDGVASAELAARFLVEARAASRLNHPNVVAVHDFGQASAEPNAPLFLVMEHLTGETLAQAIDGGEPFSVARVAAIIGQVLEALAEAHDRAITHRDVKPANVILEKRGAREHVKVIDFGVARIAADRRLTAQGRIMGTPQYIAPELVLRGEGGPSIDLYAVGIMLFELLVGRVPFDDDVPTNVLDMHTSAPRPDPRRVAPDRRVPAALAEVCMRSIAVDPNHRYPDARALAQAIAEAASDAEGETHPETLGRATRSVAPHAPTMPIETNESLARVRLAARASSPSLRELSLVGREDAVAMARETLATPVGVAAILVRGRSGTGRTRVLSEVADLAAHAGALVVDVPRESPPEYEVGFACLRALVRQLAGDAGAALLQSIADGSWSSRGRSALDVLVASGLSQMFGGALPDNQPSSPPPPSARKSARAAALEGFRWAARLASERARGALVVPVIDDIDAVDSISRAVIADAIEAGGLAGVLLAMTCEEAPPRLVTDRVRVLELAGLTRAEARRLATETRGGVAADRPSDAGVTPERRIEPLYLEQLLRWRSEARDERAPVTLESLVEARLARLPAQELAVVRVLAIAGVASPEELASLAPDAGAPDAAIDALVEKGFVRLDGRRARLTHASYGRLASNMAPRAVVEELHAAAAEAIASAGGDLERHAYHALRGRADRAATSLLDAVARIRAGRGDDEGTIAALNDAYVAARERMARGEGDPLATGWHAFGCKLAQVLADAGRLEQAHGVLLEVLQWLGPDGRGRTAPLEQLARVATLRGRHGEAARWWRAAEAAVDDEERASAAVPRARPSEPQTGTRARPQAAVEEASPAPPRTRRSGPLPRRPIPREEVEDDEEAPGSKRDAR